MGCKKSTGKIEKQKRLIFCFAERVLNCCEFTQILTGKNSISHKKQMIFSVNPIVTLKK